MLEMKDVPEAGERGWWMKSEFPVCKAALERPRNTRK